MNLISCVVTFIVCLVASATLLERRRKRRIAEVIEGRGGKVLKIRWEGGPTDQRTVRYVGAQGEWRQAQALLGKPPVLQEDISYQEVLRRKYEKRPPLTMFDILARAGIVLSLPGYADYYAIFRSLTKDNAELERIEESSPNKRFAPVLQCLEVAALGASDPHVLEMTVDGVNVTVRWSVMGYAPRRVLILKKIP
jgi:hypothetical protein